MSAMSRIINWFPEVVGRGPIIKTYLQIQPGEGPVVLADEDPSSCNPEPLRINYIEPGAAKETRLES